MLLERNLIDALSEALILFLLCRNVNSFLKYDADVAFRYAVGSEIMLPLRKYAEISGVPGTSTEQRK